MTRRTFVLINPRVRSNALEAVRYAAEGFVVTVAQPTRSNEQNAKLHALLTDLARSGLEWAGKRRSVEEWKALIISAHAVATKHGGEVVPGIEGEFVAIRESSATMTVSRATSLIEYLTAFCVGRGVELRDTTRGGFNDYQPAPDDVPTSQGAARESRPSPSSQAGSPAPSNSYREARS